HERELARERAEELSARPYGHDRRHRQRGVISRVRRRILRERRYARRRRRPVAALGTDSRRRLMPTPAWASGVCAGVHATGSRDVVYVPDNPLSQVLRECAGRFRDVRLVLATREEEAFGIAAGLFLGGRRPAVMLQSSGLGNSLNAITSLVIPYRIPVLILVS